MFCIVYAKNLDLQVMWKNTLSRIACFRSTRYQNYSSVASLILYAVFLQHIRRILSSWNRTGTGFDHAQCDALNKPSESQTRHNCAEPTNLMSCPTKYVASIVCCFTIQTMWSAAFKTRRSCRRCGHSRSFPRRAVSSFPGCLLGACCVSNVECARECCLETQGAHWFCRCYKSLWK